MSVPKSERYFSAQDLRDGKRLGLYDPKQPGRGLLYYATGDYWPKELDRRALEHARLSAAAESLANALRREQRAWPRGSGGSIPNPHTED